MGAERASEAKRIENPLSEAPWRGNLGFPWGAEQVSESERARRQK